MGSSVPHRVGEKLPGISPTSANIFETTVVCQVLAAEGQGGGRYVLQIPGGVVTYHQKPSGKISGITFLLVLETRCLESGQQGHGSLRAPGKHLPCFFVYRSCWHTSVFFTSSLASLPWPLYSDDSYWI